MKYFGAIYIGSYEIILKIFNISKSKGVKEIDSLSTQVDILSDITVNGVMSIPSVDRLTGILLDMKKSMAEYGVDDYKAYAGYVLAQAENHLIVLEQIKIKTGIEIEILSNSERRFLSYMAVAEKPGFEDVIKNSTVIVDIGGASIQFTLFEKGKLITTQHIPIGIATLYKRMSQMAHVANFNAQISEMVEKEIEVFKLMFAPRDQIETAYMVGMLDIPENYDVVYEHEELVLPFRIISEAINKVLNPRNSIIPDISINEGIALDYGFNNKLIKRNHDYGEDVLSASWAISKRFMSYQPHLKALCGFATLIFDAMKKYHGMNSKDRLMMEVICILHDCGKYISINNSAESSYRIIMSNEILGLTHKEREIIATVVSRNRMMAEAYEDVSDKFTKEEYVKAVKLLAILKVANALDRSHKQKLKDVSMSVKKNELIISVHSSSSFALERGMFSEKAAFFESVFAIKPVIVER